MLGRAISHYKIVEKLGEGGMGVVYKAEDTKLQRKVALKFLPPRALDNEALKARFLQEAQAAAALNHPNICTIHEIDEADGQFFIAMEWVEGQSLKQKIRSRPLKLAEALEIVLQAAKGLRAAHAKGVVHRDIKSANVMVNNEGQAKIMDFGLARLGDEKGITQTGTTLGTLLYMAPEQAEGQTVDQRADIWSLGVVLYEMVSGRLPFEGDVEAAVLRSILYEKPEPLTAVQSKVPQALDEVIAKALAKDRNERYQDVSELLEDLRVLERQIESQSDSTKPNKRPITKAQREARARARRRRLVWALSIAAAAVVLTGAGLAVRNFLPNAEAPLEPPKLVPFTSYEGNENYPSFSPDGNQIVFTWNGPQQDNEDIYVKLIGTETPLRLTTDSRMDSVPVFSPDGRSIVFYRQLGREKVGVFVVPALGGPERQLTEALLRWGPAWSPDGKHLVISDRVSDGEALVAFSLETGEKRMLTRPAPSGGLVVSSAFSPDGRTLAFTRVGSIVSAVHLLDLDENLQPTGEERKLTPPQWRARLPAWTVDGSEVVFVSEQNAAQDSLMRMTISGGQPRPVALGAGGVFPAISKQGNRLAFATSPTQTNIWRIKVAGPGGKAGPPTKLISSTRTDVFPQYSPDGEKIAFASTRSGSRQVWVSDSDGSNAKQLTHAFDAADTPDWSPDGNRIAFMSRTETEEPEIYVTDARGGVPKRLTTDSASDALPRWSRDGQWIILQLEPWRSVGGLENARRGGAGRPGDSRRRIRAQGISRRKVSLLFSACRVSSWLRLENASRGG